MQHIVKTQAELDAALARDDLDVLQVRARVPEDWYGCNQRPRRSE